MEPPSDNISTEREAPHGGHAVSLYDAFGQPRGHTREDLWAVLVQRPCWLVDNNVDWEGIARAEPEQNFVLGRTMVMESDSLRGALRRIGAAPLSNVYTMETQPVRGEQTIVIDRLGSTLRRKFAGLPPTVERLTDEAREAVNATAIREAKRQRVHRHEARVPAELLADVLRSLPLTYRNYPYAGEVSLALYAYHLGELRVGPAADRVLRFEQNHPNLFGDAEMIQEALFLGIGILSNDHYDVLRMAALAGVPCRSSRPAPSR